VSLGVVHLGCHYPLVCSGLQNPDAVVVSAGGQNLPTRAASLVEHPRDRMGETRCQIPEVPTATAVTSNLSMTRSSHALLIPGHIGQSMRPLRPEAK